MYTVLREVSDGSEVDGSVDGEATSTDRTPGILIVVDNVITSMVHLLILAHFSGTKDRTMCCTSAKAESSLMPSLGNW